MSTAPPFPEHLRRPPPRSDTEIGEAMVRLRKGRRFSVGFVLVALVAIGLGVAVAESEPSAAIAVPAGLGLFVVPLILGSPTYRRLVSLHRNGVHIVGRVASVSEPEFVTVGKPKRNALRWTTLIDFTGADGRVGRARLVQVVLRARRPFDADLADDRPAFEPGSDVDLVVEARAVHVWCSGNFVLAERVAPAATGA